MSKECPNCFGVGTVIHSRCKGRGCSACDEGEIDCSVCNGDGTIPGVNDNEMDEEDEIDGTEGLTTIEDVLRGEGDEDERE